MSDRLLAGHNSLLNWKCRNASLPTPAFAFLAPHCQDPSHALHGNVGASSPSPNLASVSSGESWQRSYRAVSRVFKANRHFGTICRDMSDQVFAHGNAIMAACPPWLLHPEHFFPRKPHDPNGSTQASTLSTNRSSISSGDAWGWSYGSKVRSEGILPF